MSEIDTEGLTASELRQRIDVCRRNRDYHETRAVEATKNIRAYSDVLWALEHPTGEPMPPEFAEPPPF